MELSDWLTRNEGLAGLVLTDVVRSTSLLFETHTVRYARILREHRARASELVERFDGRLIDQSGDGHLVAFPDATRAFLFARELFADSGHERLHIRVGVHFGRVRAEGDALVGRTLHVCARVMQRAEEPELWVSDEARRAIEAGSAEVAAGITWMESDDSALKGIPEPHRLWRAG